MKRVSIYIRSGNVAAVTYYRFYQYFAKIDSFCVTYRKMIPEKIYKRYMPISRANIVVRVVIATLSILRVSLSLLKDLFEPPQALIISRKLTDRLTPIYFIWILRALKRRGVKIYWDFDDNIIDSREISRSAFDSLSAVADKIIVGSPYLKPLVEREYANKIVHIPTTDGDMYMLQSDGVDALRALSLSYEIRVVWVGTSVSLNYLEPIMSVFESIGSRQRLKGDDLIFSVVCNKPLNYAAQNFTLRNIEWQREVAIEEMLRAHVGVMPLEDSRFAQGKGGFKLIQYLSVGLPVVASGVGINRDIVAGGEGCCLEGLEAREWVAAIDKITSTIGVWLGYSRRAKASWLERYSFDQALGRWQEILQS